MSDCLEAGVQVGDFRIERRLGGGGMGVVYLATQVSLDRPVALTVLGTALNRPEDIARFQREAQAVARPQHPGTASVHFVGQCGQAWYMAMAFIDGLSLRTLMHRLPPAWDTRVTLESAVGTEANGEAVARALSFDDPTETYVAPRHGDHTRVEPGPLTREAALLINTRGYVR